MLSDGRRPLLRTFTPVKVDRDELTIDIVRHPGGGVSQWVEQAQPGSVRRLGPACETIDSSATRYLLLGDETSIPAIEQLLDAIPESTKIGVHIELAHPAARIELPPHPQATIIWHDAAAEEPPGGSLHRTIEAAVIDNETRVWAAGEAASVQAIRKHLFEQRDVPRAHTTIRGYWKVPR